MLFCLKFGKLESTREWVTPTPSDNCFVRGIFVCTRKSHFLVRSPLVGDTAGSGALYLTYENSLLTEVSQRATDPYRRLVGHR